MLLENHNAIESGGYQIANSLRFQASSSSYLSRTPAGASNQTTMSFSWWMKVGALNTTERIFTSNTATNDFTIYMSGDTLTVYNYLASVTNTVITTTQVFRDPSAWYHVVVGIDSTQATASNRVKVYVNGIQVTAFSTATYPTQNSTMYWDNTNPHVIGRNNNIPGQYFDGYLSEVNFIDGVSLTPSSFGEFDSITGQWVAKKYTGVYGTNGFYLPFSNGTSTTTLGYDSSGNGNNWTLTNFTRAAGANDCWMYDVPSGNGSNFATLNPLYTGRSTLSKANLTASGTTDLPTIIPDSGNWYFEISGVAKNWTPPAAFPSGAGDYNFGQRAFANTPTSGYKTLCTSNLPVATITKGSTAMNVVLDTGANIKTSSQALYTYYLEWIKDRANANNHQLADTVRGNTAILQSNSTGAETTYTAPTGNSVGWVWNAGTATATNTNGSITSTVSVNATAGFSVVTYTGTGANATVGHGLGVAPAMIIAKQRNSGTNVWGVYHKNLTNSTYTLVLQSTQASVSDSTYWTATPPTSSVFSVGTTMSASSGTYVAYCFAAIPSFSKDFSYTGNGSADGVFTYLGFTPKLILLKRTDTTGNWIMWDTVRNTYNVLGAELYPNLSNAEATATDLDVLSNGFKIRNTTAAFNASGGTYIGFAWATNPFQNSNAF